jgi:glyoxylase-like metal-dependent hydrolase (beta-lactamase superfamily II)
VSEGEVAPGVYRLVAPLGERDVCLFLVVGTESAALIDTGVAGSPAAVLAPALAALDVDVSHIVVTHADVDHSGGLAAARALAPRALAVCHALDRPLVDSVDLMIDERYRELRHEHEIDQGPEFCDWVRANDDGGSVDAVVAPPTHIDLGDRRLAVLHTPGHTRGHLTVVDEATGTAIVADAVLAGGVPGASGESAFAPTYRYAADYRASCQALRQLAPARLLCSHFAVVEGPAEVAAFLDETDSFTVRLEEAILGALATAAQPMRAADLIAAAAPSVRTWDPGMDSTLAQPVVGHLEDLVARGLARALPGHPATFAASPLQ